MKGILNSTKVPPRNLRWKCDLELLKSWKLEGKLVGEEKIIGQERGFKALKLGLEIDFPGYNIFVSGHTGTGRKTAIRKLLKEIAPQKEVPQDIVYVHNFSRPESPTLIKLPPGKGALLSSELKKFVEIIKERLPKLLEDEEISRQRNEIAQAFGSKEQEILKNFTEEAKKDGFVIAQVEIGPIKSPSVFALFNGEPVTYERIKSAIEGGEIPKKDGERILERYVYWREELQKVLRKARDLHREMLKSVEKLYKDSARTIFSGYLNDIRNTFNHEIKVTNYLKSLEEDLIDEIVAISSLDHKPQGDGNIQEQIEGFVWKYTVNVLVDRSGLEGAPVIEENYPTFTNLFGTIEKGEDVDHRNIKAGSLLKADGGFLIISAADVLGNERVWEFLKRALRSRRLEIHQPGEEMPYGPLLIKPEPIDINVKVILVGSPGGYDALYSLDPEFRKIFKIKADFDYSMPLTEESLRHFCIVVERIRKKEELPEMDDEAFAACAEFAVREAGRRGRISTRFNEVADVIREAGFWAKETGSKKITSEHICKAVEEREGRHGLFQEHIRDMLKKEILMISTEGKKVGQVNGLSVYTTGYYSFGKPTRITASTSAGGVGIINIEREARLSGGIYDKGVLIIAGWMRRMFAQEIPLSLTASLCFEQSYSGVDGDSASVAEICAIISDLSGLPVDQGFAVTGSINQHGEVQPVGGVNEKIEGFFWLCKERGLTGKQGCIIPKKNVGDLMLKPAVVKAVESGLFSIQAVEFVEEAIEILLGVPAGFKSKKGKFPEGSVFSLVEKKLKKYAKTAKDKTKEIDPGLLAGE